jgi:hypothetical protein
MDHALGLQHLQGALHRRAADLEDLGDRSFEQHQPRRQGRGVDVSRLLLPGQSENNLGRRRAVAYKDQISTDRGLDCKWTSAAAARSFRA